ARWRAGGVWDGPARAAAGRAEPGIRAAGAGAVADGDHPVGDVGGGAGAAQGREARVLAAGRLGGPTRSGREPSEGHQRAAIAGEVAARDHEGRAVLPESPAIAVRSCSDARCTGSRTRLTTFEAAWRSLNPVAGTGSGLSFKPDIAKCA